MGTYGYSRNAYGYSSKGIASIAARHLCGQVSELVLLAQVPGDPLGPPLVELHAHVAEAVVLLAGELERLALGADPNLAREVSRLVRLLARVPGRRSRLRVTWGEGQAEGLPGGRARLRGPYCGLALPPAQRSKAHQRRGGRGVAGQGRVKAGAWRVTAGQGVRLNRSVDTWRGQGRVKAASRRDQGGGSTLGGGRLDPSVDLGREIARDVLVVTGELADLATTKRGLGS